MNAKIINIRHGRPKLSNKSDSLYIYATLINADNGVPYIHATLEYILQAVEERGYILVGDNHAG